jgi:hypothetical protein
MGPAPDAAVTESPETLNVSVDRKRGHPTHHLEQNITVEWLGVKKSLQLGKIPTAKPGGAPPPACYPSKETCQTLVWQNLFFALMGIFRCSWARSIGCVELRWPSVTKGMSISALRRSELHPVLLTPA